jgi:hypothetical protein
MYIKSILLLSLISAIKLTTASVKKVSQDMSLIPITRVELKQLKIQADEEKRKAEIAAAIKETYDKIVRYATGSTETKIQFNVVEDARMRQMDVRQQQQYRQMNEFRVHQSLNPSILITDELIGDVVSGLRELFPDSNIEYKVAVMARASDGKMYDVSKVDASMAPFIRASHTQTNKVIDVDWS